MESGKCPNFFKKTRNYCSRISLYYYFIHFIIQVNLKIDSCLAYYHYPIFTSYLMIFLLKTLFNLHYFDKKEHFNIIKFNRFFSIKIFMR